LLGISKSQKKWSNIKIGITGATGALGTSLIEKFKSKGAYVIGFTHSNTSSKANKNKAPDKWINWECGKEEELKNIFQSIDILILNHGINPKGNISTKQLSKAIEVNALSSWRIIDIFEEIATKEKLIESPKEIWINTSEAEVLPALSPGYEISKRLLGQLTSIKATFIKNESNLIIRKLVLGPFKSELNPIGIMSPDLVANQIINQAELNFKLIIVTPNPLTFLFIPFNELIRHIYFKIFSNQEINKNS